MNSSGYLDAIGIVRWQRRNMPTVTAVNNQNQSIKIMLISETPASDYKQSEQSDQLLTAMLKSIGLAYSDVYIADMAKYEESGESLYTQYIDQQITLLKPALILVLGRSAAHHLLNTKVTLESMRNKVHLYGASQTPLITTYHPAYLLRSPQDKRNTYHDLQFALSHLRKKE